MRFVWALAVVLGLAPVVGAADDSTVGQWLCDQSQGDW
jgi:hypothetical protein